MSRETVEKADAIVMEALVNGYATPSLGDNMVIKNRLKLFGYWEDGKYYLNERGMEYAMSGCCKGIMERIENTKRIDMLTIKIQSFSARRQNFSFWLSIIATLLAAMSLFK